MDDNDAAAAFVWWALIMTLIYALLFFLYKNA